MTLRIFGIAILVAVITPACDRGDGETAISLDGSPRRPDVVGVVGAVDLERVTIGTRSFSVSPDLRCLATASRRTVPLLGRKNQFVHAGISGDEVVWIGSFGPVAQIGDRPPAVLYVGTVKSLPRPREVHFSDGTLLPLGEGVSAPALSSRIRAEIDPRSGTINNIAPA